MGRQGSGGITALDMYLVVGPLTAWGLWLSQGDAAAAPQPQDCGSGGTGQDGQPRDSSTGPLAMCVLACAQLWGGLAVLEMKVGQDGIAQRMETSVVFHQALPTPEGRSAQREKGFGVCCA